MGANFSTEPVVEKHTERDQNETFTAAVSSCQGWRLSQEDEHSLILDLVGEHKASFFAVFDGHGSGRVSKHASCSLWRHLTENDKYIKGMFKEALEESFLSFDREVNESYNAQLAGTTAICILVVDNVIYCANVGDSRAVASINCECVPLSQDHKPDNASELKRILDAGGYVFSNRVNGNLALSRAFGDFHYKSNDQLPPDQQIVSPYPDIERIELNDDLDFIVLACDGIWDVLSSKEVVDFVISRLEQDVEPGLICEQLTTRCIASDYELVIGCDNMTVLLVCYTRGRSWTDYCTDIFNKHSKLLGVQRPRIFDDSLQQESRFGTDSSSIDQDLSCRNMVELARDAELGASSLSSGDIVTESEAEPVVEDTPAPSEIEAESNKPDGAQEADADNISSQHSIETTEGDQTNLTCQIDDSEPGKIVFNVEANEYEPDAVGCDLDTVQCNLETSTDCNLDNTIQSSSKEGDCNLENADVESVSEECKPDVAQGDQSDDVEPPETGAAEGSGPDVTE